MKKKSKPDILTVACIGSFVKLYGIEKEDRDNLWSYFKFKDKKKLFQAAQNRFIDPHYYPYDRRSNVIGIGFLPFVTAWLESKKIPFELQDYREWENSYTDAEIDSIDWDNLFPPKFKIRYYQVDILKEVLSHKSGIISSPTGSGKSLIIAGMARLVNVPTLILFDQVQLAHQTRKEFIDYGFNPKDLGVVQGVNNKPAKITFATIQSREKLYDLIKLFKCLIVDECHTASSKSFHELFAYSQASWRFGLSATPWDESDPAHAARVIQYLGPIIYDRKGTKELIAEGFLAKEKIKFVVCDRSKADEVIWKSSGGRDYPELYRNEIVNNEYRNMLVVKLCAMHADEKVIVLFQDIKNGHGDTLKTMLEKFAPGRSIKLLTGNDPVKERQEVIAFFEKHPNGIILASMIFNKGVNVKSVNVMINAAGGKGYVMTVQRLGRGLRKGENKEDMIYYDFLDQNSRVFNVQAKRRMSIYEKRGHSVEKINIVRK